MKLEEAASKLQEQFQIVQRTDFRDEVTLELTLGEIEPACKFAKEQLGFNFLTDLSSVDNFGDEPRFEVVYELYSMEANIHLRLKTRVSEDHLEVPTVLHLWPTANWHEREVYDMMGIRLHGHPDLRRILMWEGYPYFPLRKDFPLAGKPTDVPDVAFTKVTPMEGGPFVTLPSSSDAISREPRVRVPEDAEPGLSDKQLAKK